MTNDGIVSSSIVVPSEALLGETTMRIIEQIDSDPGPCNNHPIDFGETEDYTVNIPAGNATWLGNTTDWINPLNWNGNPSPMFDLTIPSIPAGGYYPIIKKNQNAACNKLTIASGASLTIRGNLEVKN